jgi:hypothetical protein
MSGLPKEVLKLFALGRCIEELNKAPLTKHDKQREHKRMVEGLEQADEQTLMDIFTFDAEEEMKKRGKL